MNRHWYQHYQPPAVPFCIIGKEQWGMVRTCKLPEAFAERYATHGWMVLIRDSEFPVDLYGEWNVYSDPEVPAQSNPRRTHEDDADPA